MNMTQVEAILAKRAAFHKVVEVVEIMTAERGWRHAGITEPQIIDSLLNWGADEKDHSIVSFKFLVKQEGRGGSFAIIISAADIKAVKVKRERKSKGSNSGIASGRCWF